MLLSCLYISVELTTFSTTWLTLFLLRKNKPTWKGFLGCIRCLRPFLIQSDLSVENVLVRLKPRSGFLTQSKKAFSTQLFSTENSDWLIQSKNLTFSTGSSHPHGHTATHPYQVPHCSIIQGADALMLPTTAAAAVALAALG